MKATTHEMWCVVAPDGHLFLDSIAESASDAICRYFGYRTVANYRAVVIHEWDRRKLSGFRVVPCTITIHDTRPEVE